MVLGVMWSGKYHGSVPKRICCRQIRFFFWPPETNVRNKTSTSTMYSFFPTCAGGWGGGEFENHLVLLWLDGWHLFKICDVKRCKTWEELITLQNSKTSIDTGKWNLKTSKNVKQTPPNSVWNITKIKERCLKVNVQKWPWSKTILKI